MNKRKSPKKPKGTNEYGLTYREWLILAQAPPSPEAFRAWIGGEDPSEYHPSVKGSDS